MADLIEDLNAQFGLQGQLQFLAGENGLPMARIDNGLALAEVYLHGAHITHFQPAGEEPVLWMSSAAQFQAGKAIRGGVPVIWPWFGPHPSDSSKPQHGIARTAAWQVVASEALADGRTQLQLALTDTQQTRTLWPHAFELGLTLTVGTTLDIELTARNMGEQPWEAGAALHSYFAIGDVERMHIEGLAGCDYIDKLDNNQRKQQVGDVRINEAVDRIYFHQQQVGDEADNVCMIVDEANARQIVVGSSGSRTTVVWNPWQENAKAMADFPDEGYRNMVCVEAANAAADVRRLAPDESHTLRQHIYLVKGNVL